MTALAAIAWVQRAVAAAGVLVAARVLWGVLHQAEPPAPGEAEEQVPGDW